MAGGERGLGPRQFDFGSLTAELFEELCFQLCRLEFPAAQRLAPPDMGLDFLLYEGREVARGWQAKRFTAQISWPACKASLDRARESFAPPRVTFCFARDLTGKQQKLFDTHLRSRHRDVAVDYWGGSDLAARLNTDEARPIARHFFGSPASDLRNVARAIEAGRALDTSEDALDRARTIGEFFGEHDPYFAYQTSQRPRSTDPGDAARDAVVSFERISKSQVERIDALPKSPDAKRFAPAATLTFAESGEGKAARRRFEKFLEDGGDIEFGPGEGVGFHFQSLPPAIASLVDVGSRLEGTVRVSSKRYRWQPLLIADTAGGREELPITLEPGPTDEEGWDAALRGQVGGLTMTLLVRANDDGAGGTVSMKWAYTRDRSPAAEQLQALRFLRALHRRGTMRFEDPDDQAPPPVRTRDAAVPPDLDSLIEFFENVVTVEERAGQTFEMPVTLSDADAQTAGMAATWIRDGKLPAQWSEFTLTMPPANLPAIASSSSFTVSEQAYLRLFDTEVFLGYREIALENVRVRDTEPVSDSTESLIRVTVEPATSEAQSIMMVLRPPEDS